MVILFNGRSQPVPDELLRQAQLGDTQSRELIIKKFHPYVVRIASSSCGRFLHNGVDEEISVALLALNEAIDGYSDAQGSSFTSFLQVVVKRRLIDYYRRNKSHLREIPFSEFIDQNGDEGSALDHIVQNEAEKVFIQHQQSRDRKDEITHYIKLLAQFDISLSELMKCSPKHRTARQRAVLAAQMIAGDPRLVQYFLRHKELPLKEIENHLPFSRKTLERHRKYIVALLLVYIEELPHIREYLKGDNPV